MTNLAYCSTYIGSSNLPAIELAEKLAGFAYPQFNTTYFTSGGPNQMKARLRLRVTIGSAKVSRASSRSSPATGPYHGVYFGSHERHRPAHVLGDV